MFQKLCGCWLLMMVLLSLPLLTQATVIYDQTFTGVDLLRVPGVSFSTRARSASGSSLLFGPGSDGDVLMRLPLISAGTVTGGTPITAFF